MATIKRPTQQPPPAKKTAPRSTVTVKVSTEQYAKLDRVARKFQSSIEYVLGRLIDRLDEQASAPRRSDTAHDLAERAVEAGRQANRNRRVDL